MRHRDTLLSLDIGPNDILYRIHRVLEGVDRVDRVVYVTINDPTLIPEERQTYGPYILAELSKLEEWDGDWTTLTVCRRSGGVWCEADAFSPHALLVDQMSVDLPRYDIINLPVLRSINHRVSEVRFGQDTCFLKIARFPHELLSLAKEIKAYDILTDSGLAPRFIGYAFEETDKRVVGFLCESIIGDFAGVDDLKCCIRGLQGLHEHGIVHGDVNKYNILITPKGPVFVDFENSKLYEEATDLAKEEELKSLKAELQDDSGKGRPWGYTSCMEGFPPEVKKA